MFNSFFFFFFEKFRSSFNPNLNGQNKGQHRECRGQLFLCTYGKLTSSKGRSDCIPSAVCTKPMLWIAQCPLRGRANQSLILLQPGPIRVTATMQWQQANTPSDPGVRSFRNRESSFTSTATKLQKGFLQEY